MRNSPLSWFLCLSIRLQLLLLLLLVMVPSIGIIIDSAIYKRSEIIKHTHADLSQLADFMAYNQQNIVFSTQQMGSELAKIPEVKNHKALLLPKILADRLKMNPYCSGIVVSDRHGNVSASFPRQTKLRSIANKRSFKNAKASGLFSSGEYTSENVADSTLFSFSYPLTKTDGTFDGVIDIEISRNVYQIIHQNKVFQTNFNFIIVDNNGVILYSHLYPNIVGKRDRSDNFAVMQNGYESGNFFKGEGNDGILRLLCFRKARLEHEIAPYMFIRVSKKYEKLLENENRELLLNTLTLGAVAITAFFLVGLIGHRSITERVKALETAALRLADGDLNTRVSTDIAGGELGRLAGVFNQMAEQLEERDRIHETLLAKLQALNQSFEDVREEERRNVARELHDQMGQALTGFNLDLNWLVAQLDKETALKLDSHIIGMNIAVENMIAIVQNICARLSPPLLENLGLAAAIGHHLADLQRKSDISCHLMLDEGTDNYLGKEESMAMFRILQEALTNVIRHANADEVAISLCLGTKCVVLEIADNGKGITDIEISSPNAFGMLGMKERAVKCSGVLVVSNNPGGGTIVRLEVPRQT